MERHGFYGCINLLDGRLFNVFLVPLEALAIDILLRFIVFNSRGRFSLLSLLSDLLLSSAALNFSSICSMSSI